MYYLFVILLLFPVSSLEQIALCSENTRQCTQADDIMMQFCTIPFQGEVKDATVVGCEICQQKNTLGFLIGRCASQVKFCSNEKKIDCTLTKPQYGNFCGLQPGKPPTDISYGVCCKGGSYTQIMARKCPFPTAWADTLSEDSFFVKCPNRYPGAYGCTNFPVCGLMRNGTTHTFKTKCLACSNPDLIGYKLNECQINGDNYTYCQKQFILRGLPCPTIANKVCAIPYIGFPFDGVSGYCGVCTHTVEESGYTVLKLPFRSDTNAYLKGSCSIYLKKCPAQRVDCSKSLASKVKACGFKAGEAPVDLEVALCCQGTNYTHFMIGKCPNKL